MYNIHTPVISYKITRTDREKLAEALKKLGTKQVFIATANIYLDPKKRSDIISELKDNCEFFKARGFTASTWHWSFRVHEKNPFRGKVPFAKYDNSQSCCPTDEEFIKYMQGYMKEVASTGVDMILMDDDFKVGFTCCCDEHLRLVSEAVGESITSSDELLKKITTGGKNKYRDALRSINGNLLKNYARKLREAVDEVNPNVRIGLCAVMDTWDTDGVDSATLSRILAGNTKPFIRLIGAPYWAVDRLYDKKTYLQDTFDLMRMERSWCGEGIEIVAEGDTYPRPRHVTPASYLELYDIAMRADGTLDGILKYSLDYFAKPEYETGYLNAQLKNEKTYALVEEYFGGKEHKGVRVYESMDKYSNMTVPPQIQGTIEIAKMFYPVGCRMISHSSVPLTFYGDGVCSVAVGENASSVPESVLKNGIILDCEGARLLEKRGIDTGLKSIGESVFVAEEYFVGTDDYSRGGFNAHIIETKEGAVIDSYICSGDKRYPGSYRYENAKGERFFVFVFDGYFNTVDIYRSYARSYQINEAVKWVSGKKLPAYSYGNPDLYIMAKEKDGAMAVGLWNCFADGIEKPVVELDREYSEIRFINCEGELSGNKVTLSYMEPYSFAGFEVK